MNSIKPFRYSEPIRGVQVKPLTEDGKKISILYKGLLSEKGAERFIYIADTATNKTGVTPATSQWSGPRRAGKMISLAGRSSAELCFEGQHGKLG